jgi:hypothetical protein
MTFPAATSFGRTVLPTTTGSTLLGATSLWWRRWSWARDALHETTQKSAWFISPVDNACHSCCRDCRCAAMGRLRTCCHSAVLCCHSAVQSQCSAVTVQCSAVTVHVCTPCHCCSPAPGVRTRMWLHAHAAQSRVQSSPQHSMHKHSTACTSTAQHAHAQHSMHKHSTAQHSTATASLTRFYTNRVYTNRTVLPPPPHQTSVCGRVFHRRRPLQASECSARPASTATCTTTTGA